MRVRRIVAGTDRNTSVFLEDGPVKRFHAFKHVPGFEVSLLWSTPASPRLDSGFDDPISDETSYLPGPGETRLMVITFPPDSVFMSQDFDFQAAGEEQLKHLKGIAETFDPENPGMHKTPTIDYGIVLEGSVLLELDNQETREVSEHDVVVMQGNVHAWRNPHDTPAVIAFVLIGSSS